MTSQFRVISVSADFCFKAYVSIGQMFRLQPVFKGVFIVLLSPKSRFTGGGKTYLTLNAS